MPYNAFVRETIQFFAKGLWRWEVVAIGSPLIYGFGVGAMYADDYVVGAVLYFLGIARLSAKFLTWEETKRHPQRMSVYLLVIIFAIGLFGGSLLWVTHRHTMHIAEKLEQSPKKDVASYRPSVYRRAGISNLLIIRFCRQFLPNA